MTVKVDRIEPNIFPTVEYVDARDAGRNAELIFGVKIDGRIIPVTISSVMKKPMPWQLFWSPSERLVNHSKSCPKDAVARFNLIFSFRFPRGSVSSHEERPAAESLHDH